MLIFAFSVGAVEVEEESNCTCSVNGTVLTVSGRGTLDLIGSASWAVNITTVIVEEGITAIAPYSFDGYRSMTEISLPSTLKTIGEGTFSGCSSLVEITIPKSVTHIDYNGLFERCNSLVNIFVEDGNNFYTDIDGVLFNRQQDILLKYPCARTESLYVVPSTVRTIADYAFQDAKNLTDVELHDNLTRIGLGAFDGTQMINDSKNVFNGVVYIDNYLISVEDKDITFCIVRTGTKIVADGALQFAKKIERIVFCDGLTHIGNYTVYNCSKLIMVYFPKSLVSIGDGAFENCPFSAGIYYAGSFRDKEKIRIGALNYYLEKRSWYFERTSDDVIDHIWETTVLKLPNCTETGLKRLTCTFCAEEKYEDIPIDESNHVPEEWIRTVEPTCSEAGSEEGTCTLCGTFVTREVDTVDHSFGEWNISSSVACDIGTVKTRACSVCSHVERIVTDVKEHSFGEQSVLKQPTEHENGMAISICSVCGILKSEEIPMLPATYSINVAAVVIAVAIGLAIIATVTVIIVIMVKKRKRKK
jgi:hypothetical protein